MGQGSVATLALAFGGLVAIAACDGDEGGTGAGDGGADAGVTPDGAPGSGSGRDASSSTGCCKAKPAFLAQVIDAGGSANAFQMACEQLNTAQFPESIAKERCFETGEKWCEWTCP